MHRVARFFLPAAFLTASIFAWVTPDARAQDASSSADTGVAADGETDAPVLQSTDDTEEKTVPEASPYLVDWTLQDSDVNLVWDGYWRIRFVSGGAFGRKTDDNVFRGLSRGTAFVQEPDLTLSLWMNNRWFIETTFLEGFDRNTYRAGYVGRSGEFVREVTAGNAGVNADAFAGAKVPRPDFNTPGIVGKFATDRSEHQLLFRYDPTDPETKTFFGSYEVDSQDIGLPDFVEGRYFLLPDTGVSNVEVYLEDANGSVTGTDGMGTTRRYRRAEPVEFFVDESEGTLELAEAHDGQVIAYYAVGAADVGDAGLGGGFVVTPDANLHPDLEEPISYSTFNFTGAVNPYDPEGRAFSETSRVNIGGTDHLVLSAPGTFSPFERQNVYLSPRSLPQESWRVVPMIKDRGSYPAVSVDFGFSVDAEERTVEVYSTDPAATSLRDPRNRYPFAVDDPAAYGPGRITDPDKLSRLLVLAVRESNSDYYLGSGVIPGSVSVRINGVTDTSAEVTDDGYLQFSRYVYADDWIEVDYRTESLDLDGGDLFLYQGNRFALGPNLTLELAESVRWNLSREKSSEEYGESPGEITVSSTLDWETANAGVSVAADASLATPDTVGNLRLYGMEDGELSLALYDETVVASPDSVPGYNSAGRADLDRYDYIAYDGLGREILYNYLWSGASSTGDDGPALAADLSGDPTDGRVMDMRFDLAGGEWSAGDALADTYGPINLSGYSALAIPVRFLDDYGGSGLGGTAPTILLQIGEIGEAEDHHDDGSVNGADPGAYVELNLANAEWNSGDLDDAWTSGNWRKAVFPLSSADRAKLGSVRSWRLVIDSTPSGAVSGRIIAGPPQMEGSSFRTVVRDSSDNLVPDQDATSDEVLDSSLGSAYPETNETFHAGGEDNKSLLIRWGDQAPGGGNLAPNDRWEAVSWFSGVPMSAYRKAVFYVKPGQDGLGDLTASITDKDGKGITVTWNYGAGTGGTWDRIEVDIPDGTASSDLGTGFTVTVDKNAGELSRFLLSGADEMGDAANSADSGTLYLDEIHFTDPAYSVTGTAGIDGHWNYPDDVAAIGDFPVLGDISVNGETEVTGGKVLSGVDGGNTVTTGELGVGADVLGVGFRTDWRAAWGLGEKNWSGSHSLRIPARSETFWIGDTYSRGVSGDEATFSRRSDMNLRLKPGSATLYGEASYDGSSFVQAWGGATGWHGEAWRANIDVEYAQETGGEATTEHGYMESWIRDYAYIIPSRDEVTEREARHKLDTLVRWGPASIVWNPQLGFAVSDSPDWTQENSWEGTLSLPLEFEGWSLTPAYSRDLSQTMDTAGRSNGGFDDAWGAFFDGMSGQWPLFSYAPFGELYGKGAFASFESLTEGLDEADYEAEFSVDARRSPGTHWADLLLPSGAKLSTAREYQRRGDTAGWEDEWSASLNFTAYNLFGAFGRYPLFSFYNTEELTGLIQFTMEGINETTAPSPEELTWQLDWGFEGNRNRKLVLHQRASWHWDAEKRETIEEGRVEYHWRSASRDVLHLPFVNRAIPRQHHMESIERIAVSGEFPWKDAPNDIVLDFGVTLYHETSWVFRDFGRFTGWMAFGLGGTDGLITNGWEIGLEAEVHF